MAILCYAYEKFRRQSSEACIHYKLVSFSGTLGSIANMYVMDDCEERRPNEAISTFLRGGLISTIATFESFVLDLLKEACSTIKYCAKSCAENCNDCKKLNCEHIFKPLKEFWKKQDPAFKHELKQRINDWEKKPLNITYHSWNDLYSTVLVGGADTLTDVILEQAPLDYRYIISDSGLYSDIKITKRVSGSDSNKFREQRVKNRERRRTAAETNTTETNREEDESIICALMRLFYGIRCVMAHGNSDQTFGKEGVREGVLHDWPACQTCRGNPTHKCIVEIDDLVHHYNSYLNHMEKPKDRTDAEKDVRRIPIKTAFESFKTNDLSDGKVPALKDTEWDDALYIIDQYYHDITQPPCNPLPSSCAYYHMCRVKHWLKESQREMYITYRQLVRINQFIQMLGFRMYLAVAEILMKKYGFQNGIWGLEQSGIKEEIKKFNEGHHDIVEKTCSLPCLRQD